MRFARQKGEPLRLYTQRLDTLALKLKNLQTEFPERFLGWLLLKRSAIPEWQEATVRSAIGKSLTRAAVRQQTVKMFGVDSVPHGRNLECVQRMIYHAHMVDPAEEPWEEEDTP